MLEKTENVADAVERRPVPMENAATSGGRVLKTKPRRPPRKRRKPFVL